uniref:conserved oligomeric Golgi complex subunit 5 n=1 Tax=Myxine glutinosa TaxID=7769 RepID=UPI00359007C5
MTALSVETADTFNDLLREESFGEFAADGFDLKRYASRCVATAAVGEQLGWLSQGIAQLDRALQAQVTARHEDLLVQANGIESLEGVLQMMQARIQALRTAVDRIRGKVVEPYTKLQARTAQLAKLQSACDLLRRIVRVLSLSRRLQTQLQGGSRDVTKAAQSLGELDHLCRGADLTGIHAVEGDLLLVARARGELENQANRMLEQGMDSQNPSQVSMALQVFYHLGMLAEAAQSTLSTIRVRLQSSAQRALDVKELTKAQLVIVRGGGPGRASNSFGSAVAFRASLWTNFECLMDEVFSSCLQVLQLQRVLLRKRDPVTHVCFAEELVKKGLVNVMADFWEFVQHTLNTELQQSTGASPLLRQACEGEFPKLLRLYGDLWKRLHLTASVPALTSLASDPDYPSSDSDEWNVFSDVEQGKSLKAGLKPYENVYLNESLSRLFDPVNLALPSGAVSPPTTDEIDGIAHAISSELSVALVDPGLALAVARNVSKSLQYYATKAEQLLSTEPDASQVIGPPTECQRRNVTVVNSLYHLHGAVSKVLSDLSDLPSSAQECIVEALEALIQLMAMALHPQLRSVVDSVEAILFTMHQEEFSCSSATREPPCSGYMRELQNFVSRSTADYFSQFACRAMVAKALAPLACRVLDLFVRLACLICPLSEAGKLRLAADCAQMELAIVPYCPRLSDLGRPYRMLRAFRPLLFQTSEHVAASPALGDPMPYSYALLLLLSRSPPALKSPHQRADWTVKQFSQWLDSHPCEQERLFLIKGAFEAYVQSVRTAGGTQYAPIYPTLLQLLQMALAAQS